jgi:hypothetical protein
MVGFVGGLGTAHFPPSAARPLNQELAAINQPGYCFKLFSGYCPLCAHHWMRKEFGAHFLKRLSPDQIANGPKVIVYGYSLGAPAALLFSRMLQRDGVPIEMAVTIDSKGFTEGIIPHNVKTAVNYYEQRLFPFLFGKRHMHPEDPEKTLFLGNIRIAHTGHMKIASMPLVRETLVSAVRKAYGQDDKPVAALADQEVRLDLARLPLRMPGAYLH